MNLIHQSVSTARTAGYPLLVRRATASGWSCVSSSSPRNKSVLDRGGSPRLPRIDVVRHKVRSGPFAMLINGQHKLGMGFARALVEQAREIT